MIVTSPVSVAASVAIPQVVRSFRSITRKSSSDDTLSCPDADDAAEHQKGNDKQPINEHEWRDHAELPAVVS